MTVQERDHQRLTATDPRRRAPARRAQAVLLLVLGLGAAVASLLGPLGVGWIDYHVSSGAADQLRGGDVAGLVLVAPVALVAAWLVRAGRPGADALALAPASYGLYMYSELAVTGDLARYTGNSERWFPLLWLLVTVSLAVLALAGAGLARSEAPPARPGLERVTGWYLLAVAFFLTVGLHLPGLADAWREVPVSEEYLADPVAFWVVKLFDLGYVVPVVVAVGVGLLLRAAWARRLLAPVAGWCALLATSVAGMGLTMLATEAPGASVPLAGGFTVAAAVALGLAVAAYRGLLQESGP